MYGGTMLFTNWGPKRWRAPKTASGIAKHSGPRATILSRPRALAISFLAANAPIKRSAIPAAHMAAARPGTARNAARMIPGMGAMRSTAHDPRRRRVLSNGLVGPVRERVAPLG